MKNNKRYAGSYNENYLRQHLSELQRKHIKSNTFLKTFTRKLTSQLSELIDTIIREDVQQWNPCIVFNERLEGNVDWFTNSISQIMILLFGEKTLSYRQYLFDIKEEYHFLPCGTRDKDKIQGAFENVSRTKMISSTYILPTVIVNSNGLNKVGLRSYTPSKCASEDNTSLQLIVYLGTILILNAESVKLTHYK